MIDGCVCLYYIFYIVHSMLVSIFSHMHVFKSLFRLMDYIIRKKTRKTCWDYAYSCYVFVNLQAVAAGSLINLATVLYLNSIRVSYSAILFVLIV